MILGAAGEDVGRRRSTGGGGMEGRDVLVASAGLVGSHHPKQGRTPACGASTSAGVLPSCQHSCPGPGHPACRWLDACRGSEETALFSHPLLLLGGFPFGPDSEGQL